MKKLTATLLCLILVIQTVPAISAKQTGNWNAVKALIDQPIAFKLRNRDVVFGILQFADDAVLKVQIAEKENFSSQEVNLRREEVEKVWRAKLSFGETNISKGIWIGAGVGASVTAVTLIAVSGKENADRALGVIWLPLLGAGVGALIGSIRKKKHKKQQLIYSA